MNGLFSAGTLRVLWHTAASAGETQAGMADVPVFVQGKETRSLNTDCQKHPDIRKERAANNVRTLFLWQPRAGLRMSANMHQSQGPLQATRTASATTSLSSQCLDVQVYLHHGTSA